MNGAAADLLIVLLLFLAIFVLLYRTRDYYIVQRLYFDRLYRDPWRGKLFAAYYESFDNYLAARALFDLNEGQYISVLDTDQQEAEHSLFVVPARSKAGAVSRLKAGKAHDKALLHKTPFNVILARRSYWQKAAKEGAEQPT
jgi:hypothetical protein